MSDTPRIAQAFIEVHARKARTFDEDVRRAGQEAGQAYSKEFEKNADKGVTGSKAKHVAQGKAIGADIGDAAGAEAGSRTSKGITDGLVRARSRRVREGEDVGVSLGDGASKGFGSRFLTGLRATSTRAGKTLESDIYAGLSKGFKRGLVGAAGIGALASSASGLGTVVAGTVGAVTQLSGAIALLPAVGAAGAVSMAALKIGVHDVGDALSNSSDPKAYAEALKKLSPAAQSFTKAVVKLKPELKGLRNEVQQGLFKGLDKQVTALGSRYIPILSKGLTRVAEGFNRGAVSVGKFLDSSKASGQVSLILNNTSRAATNLGKAFEPAVAGFLDLAEVGSGFLPKLAGGLGDAASRFAKFVDQSKRSGELESFIQGGIDGFKELGKVGLNAGRILGGIFGAGGGAQGGALAALADLLGRVADQVGRPEFQQGLGRFFDSIKSAGASVGGALPAVADALIALEPAISKLVSGSGTALASILTSVSSAAVSLAPTLNVVAGAFESIAPHAGALVIALVAVKGALLGLKTASGVVDGLATIRGQITNVGESASKAKTKAGGLTVGIGKLGGALAAYGAISTGLETLAPNFDETAVSVGRVTAALNGLKSGGAGLDVGSFGKDFENLGKQLKDFSDPGVVARVEDAFFAFGGALKLGGSKDGRFQRQEAVADFKSLDATLTGLVQGGQAGKAASQFDELNAKAAASGAGIGQLANHLPQFRSALEASGRSIDSTSGKVAGLGMSIEELARKTSESASKTLAANASARGYEAALDLASAAAKRNGATLKATTAAGRENSEALDQIASSGLAYAQQILDNGGSEARFQGALSRTRSDLIAAAQKFGLGKTAAQRYATSILGIPRSAKTTIQMYGIKNAITNASTLADRLANIPRNVISHVRTEYLDVFASEVAHDAQTAKRHHRASGGFIDPRLGGPRQDNVPLLVSGGEFVVNAFATGQPGVLALLRKINASNQLPQKLATGGQVARSAAVGLNDISNSQPDRIERIVQARQAAPPAPTGELTVRIHPDDLATMARLNRDLKVVLSTGELAGAVYRAGGRF